MRKRRKQAGRSQKPIVENATPTGKLGLEAVGRIFLNATAEAGLMMASGIGVGLILNDKESEPSAALWIAGAIYIGSVFCRITAAWLEHPDDWH